LAISSFVRPVRGRLALAIALLGLVLVGAAVAALQPAGGALDRLGYDLLPDQWSQPFWHHVSSLGDPLAVVLGALVSATWLLGRDRRRAATCVVAPLASMLLCEVVIKPLVGRRLGGVYSYPSGHVTAAAALLADLVLAAPRRWRWVAAPVAVGASALVAVAVVADRQHYLSDAVAGLLLAPAVLLLVDSVNRPGLLAAVTRAGRHGVEEGSATVRTEPD